jgi:hypothetical protein
VPAKLAQTTFIYTLEIEGHFRISELGSIGRKLAFELQGPDNFMALIYRRFQHVRLL